MAVAARQPDLWTLVRKSPSVDPNDLLAAVEAECLLPDHDYRTRLLIRDSLRALTGHWGEGPLRMRLSPLARSLGEQAERDDMGDRGFPTLMRRIMEKTTPDEIIEFLRDLGRTARQPCRIDIGGSTALILRELISRHTDDIDAVNEVPASIRNQHDRLNELAREYGLMLNHFQSHYLPQGWERRVESFGVFGEMKVFLVDAIDIFVGKLFSHRAKDLTDLRVLKPRLDWDTVASRLKSSAGPLRGEARMLEAAEHNWYVLTGDALPPAD